MAVTIKDIALKANVAPSTVSRALYNHSRISAETRKRIQRLARELGYSRSMIARGMVTRETATIGMIITTVSDPYLGPLVRGVEDAARQCRYTVFLKSAYRREREERAVLRAFYERRVNGIIVTGSQLERKYLKLREHFPLPVVLINCRLYPYSVSTDNVAGAVKAMEHLLALGHRRIAYISNPHSQQTNADRLSGYRFSLQKHGLEEEEALIIPGNGHMDGGLRAIEALMTQPAAPTALLCFNDMTAIGAVYGLRQLGKRVPEDCSVVGFDDLELARYYCPPITTVRQPSYRVGRQAMQMLQQLIQGITPVEPQILPAELILRETTGPSPAG